MQFKLLGKSFYIISINDISKKFINITFMEQQHSKDDEIINENSIELFGVNKKIGSKLILDDISFTVKKGTVHLIIGDNGSGKTTILKTISRIIFCDAGIVKVFGLEPSDPNYGKDISFINFLPFFDRLDDNITLEEYIYKISYYLGISRKHVLEEFSKSSIFKIQKSFLREISNGDAKKAQFFLSFISNPSIFIMDEPFANLDVLSKKEMLHFIKNSKITGKTFLIATHDVEDFDSLTDNLTIIHKGCVVYSGVYSQEVIEKFYKNRMSNVLL